MNTDISAPLDGTVALITGASSGIGEAAARGLAAQGAVVALVARRQDRLDALAVSIREAGGTAHPYPVDVTEDGEAAAVVERVVADLGRLDVVVNSAGVMLIGPALDAPIEEWQRSVDLNVSALLRVSHAALPHLVSAAKDGPRQVADLVNISSIAGRVASGGSAVYNLTKFGVTAFSEAIRQELGAQHVRVGVIEPGAVATELAQHIRDGVRANTEAWYASMENLQSEDVADAITYMVTRPRHNAINEIVLRPTGQR